MSLLAEALTIATLAHAGQTDKGGRPYIEHPQRVAGRLMRQGYEPHVVAAGLLHDVVEDTDLTIEDLRSMLGQGRERDYRPDVGIGVVVDAVHLVAVLTHREHETREDYYARILAAGPEAVAIKRADMADNLDKDRLDRVARTGPTGINAVDWHGRTAEGKATVRRLVRKYEAACVALGLDLDEVAGYDPVQYWDAT